MAMALKLLNTIILLWTTKVSAQAIETTLSNCVKVTGYYFCNPNNVSTNPARPAYEGYGYCCKNGITDDNCKESDSKEGFDCTLGDVTV